MAMQCISLRAYKETDQKYMKKAVISQWPIEERRYMKTELKSAILIEFGTKNGDRHNTGKVERLNM